jgi:amino acid transporter
MTDQLATDQLAADQLATDQLEKSGDTNLKKDTLGVPGIVFLVLAAVAPLVVLIVVIPLAVGLGNGAGAPAAFAILTIAYLLEVIGYAKMTRVIISAGGFYAFIIKGLGRIPGLISGFIATFGYNMFVVGNIATCGFFFQTVIHNFTGFFLPWYGWGLIILWLAAFCAYIGIDFSAELLGVGLTLEVLTLIAFDIGVFIHTGFALQAFSFHSIFGTGTLAIAFLMASLSFLGFEATALYGEEAKEPRKTVGRATYTAVLCIGVLFTITAWALVSAIGAAAAQSTALQHLNAGDIAFILAGKYVGSWLSSIMQVLVLVSLSAAMLSFHNAATRYWFALGRARIFHRVFARTTKKGSPWVAIGMQAGLSTIITIPLILAHLSPLGTILPAFIGFATLAAITLQMLAALAFVVWFRRSRDSRWLSTFLAPGIAFLFLLWLTIMVIIHFDVVAGSKNAVIGALPVLLGVSVVAGVVYGYYLKRRKQMVYEGLATDIERL